MESERSDWPTLCSRSIGHCIRLSLKWNTRVSTLQTVWHSVWTLTGERNHTSGNLSEIFVRYPSDLWVHVRTRHWRSSSLFPIVHTLVQKSLLILNSMTSDSQSRKVYQVCMNSLRVDIWTMIASGTEVRTQVLFQLHVCTVQPKVPELWIMQSCSSCVKNKKPNSATHETLMVNKGFPASVRSSQGDTRWRWETLTAICGTRSNVSKVKCKHRSHMRHSNKG